MENELLKNSDFIMYTTDDGQVEIEVRLEDENVWLTQKAMAELFDTTKQNISLHINNIFEEPIKPITFGDIIFWMLSGQSGWVCLVKV